MANRSKAKGNTYERELRDEWNEEGFDMERAWGSNGASLGLPPDVDLVEHRTKLKIQAKRRKAIPEWLQIPDSCDVVAVREDRGQTIFLVRPGHLKSLLKRWVQTNAESPSKEGTSTTVSRDGDASTTGVPVPGNGSKTNTEGGIAA